MVYKAHMKDYYPKLSVSTNKTDRFIEDLYDGVEKDNPLEKIGFNRIGFPSKNNYHEPWHWNIIIHNAGEVASTNIVLEYKVILKESKFDIEDMGGGVIEPKNIRLVDYKSFKKTITIDYMGANQKKNINVLSMHGQFPAADLILIQLSSDKNKFITSPVKIDSYIHPKCRLGFADGRSIRSFYNIEDESIL